MPRCVPRRHKSADVVMKHADIYASTARDLSALSQHCMAASKQRTGSPGAPRAAVWFCQVSSCAAAVSDDRVRQRRVCLQSQAVIRLADSLQRFSEFRDRGIYRRVFRKRAKYFVTFTQTMPHRDDAHAWQLETVIDLLFESRDSW